MKFISFSVLTLLSAIYFTWLALLNVDNRPHLLFEAITFHVRDANFVSFMHPVCVLLCMKLVMSHGSLLHMNDVDILLHPLFIMSHFAIDKC